MKLRLTRVRCLILALSGLVLSFMTAWLVFTPHPGELLGTTPAPALEIVDRHGALLRLMPDGQGQRFLPVDPETMPPHLVNAVLAAEDHRFFLHPGVDPVAAVRALWQNLAAGHVVSGASTLTMQLARILEPRPRGWSSKIRQVLVALRLEVGLSKQRILAEYLSRAPLGNRLVGFEAAARVYFGKPAAQLSPAEAALLAAVPRAPSRANPWRQGDELRLRRDAILRHLNERGQLSADSFAAALQEPAVLAEDPYRTEAPQFLARVVEDSALAAARGAVRVESTLDLQLQKNVAGIARRWRNQLDPQGVGQIAVIVLDTRSGEVLALEGSARDGDEPGAAIDATQVPRQPGSALKPFTYAVAFDRGFTAATILADIPQSFTWDEGTWTPRNYDGRFHGPLRAREALACSVNVPAALVLRDIGTEHLLETLHLAGLSTLTGRAEDYGLSLTLGGGEVRLDELTAAYAALLSGGSTRTIRFWRTAHDARGHLVGQPEVPPSLRIASSEAAALVTDILADPSARAAAFGFWNVLRLPFPAAVKTGTSEGFRDNWCLGGTREVVVGVWAGQVDGSPMGQVSGVSGAGTVWRDVMLAWADLYHRGEDLESAGTLGPLPAGLERREICALSGLPAGPACPRTIQELFRVSEKRPSKSCDWHQKNDVGQVVIHWPPRFRPWAVAEGLVPQNYSYVAQSKAPSGPLSILTPSPGDSFLISNEIPLQFQTLELTVSVPGSPTEVLWLVDGREWKRVGPPFSARWPLEPGEHRFEALAGRKRSRGVTITVFGPGRPLQHPPPDKTGDLRDKSEIPETFPGEKNSILQF